MKRVEIMTVCGFGIGSSLLLKMNVDDVLSKDGFNVNVAPCDVTTATSQNADLIFTSKEIFSQLEGNVKCPVIIIDNFMSKDEIREKATPIMNEISK